MESKIAIIFSIIGIISIIIILKMFPIKENFDDTFGRKLEFNIEQDLQNQRFQTFNQNITAPWYTPYKSEKSPYVKDYPESYPNYFAVNFNKFFDFTNVQISEILKETGIKPIKDLFFENKKGLFSEDELRNYNEKTWKNRWKYFNPGKTQIFPYIKSNYNKANEINLKFLEIFNYQCSIYFATLKQTDLQLLSPFSIYKHRITQKYLIDGKDYLGTVVILIRDNGFIAYSFFIFGEWNNDKLENIWINYIGNDDYSKYLMVPGNEKREPYYQVSPKFCEKGQEWIQQQEYKKMEKEVIRSRSIDKDPLDYSYACFTYDKTLKEPYNENLYAQDKTDCLSRYNIAGYEKPDGIWDKPCQKDEECIFNGSNKNYKNNFGKCNNGKCELPLGMEILGYKYYIPEKQYEPLCYNCKSKYWKFTTELGYCCEEQKDRNKYPFLKSPDYAFKNDHLTRMNWYRKNKCIMKPIYNNIFNKPAFYKIQCGDEKHYYTNYQE